jgi:hypothetical protein
MINSPLTITRTIPLSFFRRKDNDDCKLKYVMNCLGLFVDMHNREK